MYFSMPIQWYHSHVDPIWPDGTLKNSWFWNFIPQQNYLYLYVYIIYQLETATEVEAVCPCDHHDTDGQAVLNPCKKANQRFNEPSSVVDPDP